MYNTSLTGKVIFEWLEKWPDLPSMTLARMIYNADDNHKLFTNIDTVRTRIRYYRGKSGERNRGHLATKQFIQNE